MTSDHQRQRTGLTEAAVQLAELVGVVVGGETHGPVERLPTEPEWPVLPRHQPVQRKDLWPVCDQRAGVSELAGNDPQAENRCSDE